jgi:hypothetical protein
MRETGANKGSTSRTKRLMTIEWDCPAATAGGLLRPRLAVTEENFVRSKEKGHASVSFSRPFAREGKQEGQTADMLNATRDDLAFRKATNANPSRPVPNNTRELGSGTVGAVVSNVKLMLPAELIDSDQ